MTRIRVKICGLTTPAMVREAAAAGADAIGLVLAESPRRVTPDQARDLLAAAPTGVERIAVFRTPTAADLAAIADLPFDGVQADAGWEGAQNLPADRFFLPVLADGPDLIERARQVADEVHRFAARLNVSLSGSFLIDGPRGGGRGIPVDLERATAVARLGRLVLAGGLQPETVAAAVEHVRPAAVDVSSGVEESPGIKDPRAVVRFITAVRCIEMEGKP